LLAKDPKTGKEVPWNPTPNAGWIDGSVDNDLPMTRLAEMFNVNHFIVSQVNPHVVPFLAKEEELIGAEAQQNPAFSAGPTWIHHMANLAKGEALHRLQVLSELGIFPNYLTKARSILNQRYSGDITIFPSISYAHFPKVLSNPTTEYMLQSTLTGERATWPKLSRVQNHVAIELALDETIRQFRTQIVFSNSQVNLRLNNFSRPLSQGNAVASLSKPSKRITPSTPAISSTVTTTSRRSQHLQVKCPAKPDRITRPYLPSHPLQKRSKYEMSKSLDHFSSSTNPDGSSSEGAFAGDSDTSDHVSSPSPPHSPSSQQPTLWPSTRQLFPSASQPTTPSISSSIYGYRNSSVFNLTMTAPSSPELRYKRLFHPPETAADGIHPAVNPDVVRAVENMVHPPNRVDFEAPTLQHTNSNPETQTVPRTAIARTDTSPETKMQELGMLPDASSALTSVPLMSTEVLPSTTNDAPKKLSRNEKKEMKAAERDRRSLSRRGSAQGAGLGLLLDISGTRGMMLRRKKSAMYGSGGSQG
jgi:TAG lipase/steryl ester hydrolase/phospholipase A2/LPA acyltransferase